MNQRAAYECASQPEGGHSMMGTKARLFTAVPAVTLDELVPADHFYRHVERVLDLSFVRELVQDCYASVDDRALIQWSFSNSSSSCFSKGCVPSGC